ncbi:MAG: hypothetical protein KDK62_06695 [Chlamydiia bacterium]|nr:hypothetical protein [Chlamydiia bacterium]
MDLTLSDFKVMLKRKKGKLLFCTLVTAFLFFSWGVTRDIRYKSEASFRDKGQASGMKESMHQILLSGSDKEDSETISGLTSYRLAEKLIKREGLQLEVEHKKSLYQTIQDNLRVELAYFLKEKTPSLPERKKRIQGAGVDYRGEAYLTKELTFLDDETFLVEGEGEGKLGEVFFGDGYYFILKEDPDLYPELLAGRAFQIKLHPLKPLMKDVKESIVAKSDQDDSSLVKVNFLHPDRRESARLLNSLLFLYHDFLEEERDKVNEAQLSYLEEREKGLSSVLDEAIKAHAKRVEGDVALSGFTDARREMEFLEAQLIQTNEKLNQLTLDQKRLQKILEEGVSSYDSKAPGQSDAPIINEMLGKIREYKHLSESLASELGAFGDIGEHEWQGVSVQAMQELYLKLIREKEENNQFEKQLGSLLNNFDLEDFEMTSLTSYLADPISQEKIMKASKLSHDLKDKESRTHKELLRLKEELEIEKAILKSHLKETKRLAQVRQNLLAEKHLQMQKALYLMAEKERRSQKNQLEGYLKERIQDLKQDRLVLEEKADALKTSLLKMPQKWIEEERLNQRMDQNRRLLENLASMVETKNISKNLELVQSAPLDFAYPPLHPKSPRLLLLGFLGGFMGLFLSSSYFLTRGILKETPITLKNLVANGFSAKNHPKRALGMFSSDLKVIACLNPKAFSLSDLLKSQGEKVFVIELGEYPEDDYKLLSPMEISKNTANHPKFKALLEELKPRFDRIVIETRFPLNDPDQEAVLGLSQGAMVFVKQETYQEISSLMDEIKRYKNIVFITG